MSLNLLFNFSKQASSLVALSVHENYSTLHLFRIFETLDLLG